MSAVNESAIWGGVSSYLICCVLKLLGYSTLHMPDGVIRLLPDRWESHRV